MPQMSGLANDRARQSLTNANKQALACGREYIEPNDLMLGLIQEGSGIANAVLNEVCGRQSQLESAVVATMTRGAYPPAKRGKLPLSSASKRAIELALVERSRLKHNLMGNE